MSRERRLKEIDSKFADALEYCATSGLTPTQIENCAKPVLNWTRRQKWKRKLKQLLKLSIVIVVFAVLFESETTFRWICIGSKLLQLKILPYWDWTKFHGQSCIISNHYYQEEKVSKSDCKFCQDYTDVHHLQNVSHEVMTNDYLLKHLPVIVTDAAEGWISREKFTFQYLKEIYHDQAFLNADNCVFSSNKPFNSLQDFLENILEYESFNSHWSNCHFESMKAFRKFYRRPYFLPPMIGSSVDNFVVVGLKSNKLPDDDDDTKFQPFFTIDSMTWFTQIKGNFKLNLSTQCECQSLEFILHEGETLAFNNKIWWFSYQAEGDMPAIALGSNGLWD